VRGWDFARGGRRPARGQAAGRTARITRADFVSPNDNQYTDVSLGDHPGSEGLAVMRNSA
jgi:hypothetical protein